MSPQLSPVFLHCVICSTVPFLFLRLTQDIPTLSSLCSGTIFLWMYWPSFNAALVAPDYVAQHRSVINTYFSLAAACVTTFALSPVLKKGWKLDMVSALSTIIHLSSSLFVFSVCLLFFSVLSSLSLFSVCLLLSAVVLPNPFLKFNSSKFSPGPHTKRNPGWRCSCGDCFQHGHPTMGSSADWFVCWRVEHCWICLFNGSYRKSAKREIYLVFTGNLFCPTITLVLSHLSLSCASTQRPMIRVG